MEDIEKFKIKELIALRGNYYSTILIISSGLAGLFFANIEMWKIALLTLAGIYLNVVYILKFTNVDNKIKLLTKKE